MDSQLIWVLVFCASGIVTKVDLNNDVSTTDVPYPFNRENSSYPERRWIITRGPLKDIIKGNHMEDCNLEKAPRMSAFWSRGPLCALCSQIIPKKFPSGKIMETDYACYIYGYLTFPESEDDYTLIDVLLCRYKTSENKTGRLYVTRGREESSVYFLKNIGSRNHKYVFTLDGYSIYGNKTSDQVTSEKIN